MNRENVSPETKAAQAVIRRISLQKNKTNNEVSQSKKAPLSDITSSTINNKTTCKPNTVNQYNKKKQTLSSTSLNGIGINHNSILPDPILSSHKNNRKKRTAESQPNTIIGDKNKRRLQTQIPDVVTTPIIDSSIFHGAQPNLAKHCEFPDLRYKVSPYNEKVIRNLPGIYVYDVLKENMSPAPILYPNADLRYKRRANSPANDTIGITNKRRVLDTNLEPKSTPITQGSMPQSSQSIFFNNTQLSDVHYNLPHSNHTARRNVPGLNLFQKFSSTIKPGHPT